MGVARVAYLPDFDCNATQQIAFMPKGNQCSLHGLQLLAQRANKCLLVKGAADSA